MKLHPVPPGLFCVPAAIVALTGADIESVVVPALNRRMGSLGLLDTVPGVRIYQLSGALRELGCHVREYRHDAEAGKTGARLATWARRSRERWPGRAVIICTRDHCMVLQDGIIYDNWTPHGVRAEDHAFAKTVVKWAALVERA